MGDAESSEPLFRANKRRKVVRKRTDIPDESQNTADVDHEAAEISNQADPVADSSTAAIRFQRKPIGRKHGIAFASTEGRNGAQEENEDRAIVLASASEGQDAPGNDRFTKPTGRIAVTEDKHMYVAHMDDYHSLDRNGTNGVGWHT